MRLNAELAASKELVDAQGLTLPTMAKTVRAQPGAAPVVTDGPFPETKEFLAGYWMLEVQDPRAGGGDRCPYLRSTRARRQAAQLDGRAEAGGRATRL